MKQKLCYDTWQRVNESHPVKPGERVWVQKENKQATVLAKLSNRLQPYLVEDRGVVIRRNRSGLLPNFQPSPSTEQNLLDGGISNQEAEQQSRREPIAQGVQLYAPYLAGQQDTQETWSVDFSDFTLILLKRLY